LNGMQSMLFMSASCRSHIVEKTRALLGHRSHFRLLKNKSPSSQMVLVCRAAVSFSQRCSNERRDLQREYLYSTGPPLMSAHLLKIEEFHVRRGKGRFRERTEDLRRNPSYPG
jgi:hypothetical protein